MIYDVVVGAGKQGSEVPAPRVKTFWVLLEGRTGALPLCVASPDGREALALFTGEEEARMFCCLRGDENPRLRETSAGKVLSLLYCSAIKCVALDPFPEVLGSELLGLITLGRERFARSFAGLRPLGGSPPAWSASQPDCRPRR
jgi:hypothetical protein